MNITITQDNSRIETLGSNGASIILKLYDLAIDSNNTLTLRGNISSTSAYGDLVDYLNTTYGPDFIVSATNKYLKFEDPNAERVCALYFGDGTGCTKSLLLSAYSTWSHEINGVKFMDALANAGVKKFNEFQYVLRISELEYAFFRNNTFDEITLPTGSIRIAGTIFANNNASTTVHNATSISYMEEYGSLHFKDGFILDFNKYTGRFENNGYGRSEIALCGNPYIIIPRNSLMNRTSSDNFELNEMYYTYTVVFREDFVSNTLYLRGRGNNGYDIPFYTSITSVVFLSTTPPFNSIDLSNNLSAIYVPSSAVSAYTTAINNSNRTITTLDVFANISDDNKDILVEAGCTATGSTGNWTITPPTT